MKRSSFAILCIFLAFVIFIVCYYIADRKKVDRRTLTQVAKDTRFDDGVPARLSLYDSLSNMILLDADSLIADDSQTFFSINPQNDSVTGNKKIKVMPNYTSIKQLCAKIGEPYLRGIELDRVYQSNNCALRIAVNNKRLELKSGSYNVRHWLEYKTFPKFDGGLNKSKRLSPNWKYVITFNKRVDPFEGR
ncbi:hypothetical protein [Mucilaginibacter jinjuensis]|uniref:Uncharacterized protein n=1 Tax=Mucilaginibacter jinjuensis TaxID=1176721 RepID=A0ABY7T971_9SPHI|nr:hypothetical protein [Mucilaginibacter jinjuensis]WCT12814.1 hypothetical protein PQO05_02555 [Mucilaginibacter jinjuensis]